MSEPNYHKTKFLTENLLTIEMKKTFIVHVKTDDIYKDIAEDVKTRFDTSNLEIDRPLLIGKNKKVIALMKDELGGQIIEYLAGYGQKLIVI